MRSLAERLRAGYSRWNETGDVGGILAELAPDVRVAVAERGPEGSLTFHGHAGVTEWAAGMDDAWRDVSFEPVEIQTDEAARRALVVVKVRSRGRASDVEVEGTETHVVTFGPDGKVTRIDAFGDLDHARAVFADTTPMGNLASLLDGLHPVMEISPRDEMYTGHPQHYARVGLSALAGIQVTLRAAGAGPPRRILDLPCGHGRVLRFLAAAYPEAEITACDLNTDGVEFCARAFGAVPLQSHEDPAAIALEGEYDLIWSGSLLTHLDAGELGGFLELFERHLSVAGVLAVTVNGPFTAGLLEGDENGYFTVPDEGKRALLAGYRERGFGFAPYEGRTRYGQSICTPAWTCASLARLPGLRLVTYTEQGYDWTQDLVACARPLNLGGEPVRCPARH